MDVQDVSRFGSEFLQADLSQPDACTVGAAAISSDRQLARVALRGMVRAEPARRCHGMIGVAGSPSICWRIVAATRS